MKIAKIAQGMMSAVSVSVSIAASGVAIASQASVGIATPPVSQPVNSETAFLDYRKHDTEVAPAAAQAVLADELEQTVLAQVLQPEDQACFGELNPQVTGMAQGAFTQARIQQTAYLIDLGDSCHPRGFATLRLAVFEANQLVAQADVTGLAHIKRVSDLDKDGRNEITLEGSWSGQGYFSMTAKTFVMNEAGAEVLGEFQSVLWDNFGTGRLATPSSEGSPIRKTAAVITADVQPSGEIRFLRQDYAATCSAAGRRIKCGDYRATELDSE